MEMKVDVEKIRNWREDRCWSQEHLADTAGVSLRTIQRLEKGEGVSRDTVMSLAAAFDVDVVALTVDVHRQAKEALLTQAIKKRRDASLAFWIHLITYIGVIALLFAINLNSKREGLWVVWPAIGWGVGVFAHGATVLLTNRLSNDEKEIGNFDL